MLLLGAFCSLVYTLNKQLRPFCNETNILYHVFSRQKAFLAMYEFFIWRDDFCVNLSGTSKMGDG